MPKRLRDIVSESLRTCAADHGIPPATLDVILRNLAPAVRLLTQPITNIPVGSTHAGGYPDLLDSVDWPRTQDSKEPMPFLLQVNLADITRFDVESVLPKAGLLSFFFYTFDEDSGEEGQVLYFPEVKGMSRRRPPKDLPAEERYRAIGLIPRFEWTLPSRHELNLENETFYWDMLREIDEIYEGSPHQGDDFQILGHPHFIQPGRLGNEQRLLLQVNPDYWNQGESPRATGMAWGDGGQVYYVIDNEDLKTRAFDRVTVHLDMA